MFVFLEEGSVNRTFYHEKSTDYLSLSYAAGVLNFGVKRFYKSKSIEDEDEAVRIQIRIIGITDESNIEIT